MRPITLKEARAVALHSLESAEAARRLFAETDADSVRFFAEDPDIEEPMADGD